MKTFLDFIIICGFAAFASAQNSGPIPVGGHCFFRGSNGACVDIRRCQPLLNLLINNRTPATIKLLQDSRCGSGNDQRVCCVDEVPQDQPSPQPDPKENGGEVDPYPDLPNPPYCGNSSIQSRRVVGGSDSELGSWPWLALLGYRQGKRATEWLCGGALITDKHVITAGHCIKESRSKVLFQVRLGELDLSTDQDGANPIDVLVRRAIAHPRYGKMDYDIGLVVLQNSVPFSQFIRPICLPKNFEHFSARNLERKNPFIAGWGNLAYRGKSSQKLQQLQLPVLQDDECRDVYVPLGARYSERQLCAGYKSGGHDACQGDSGGPLMLPDGSSSKFYAIGIVSYGYRCAEKGFPGIYTRVTEFMNWIAETVRNNN